MNIIEKTSHQDLGVTISSNLSWNLHYISITKKAYRSLGLLRRSISSNSIQARKMLYISLVRSKLTYCSQIWRPHLIKDILSLEKIQRRATKFILSDYSSDYKSRLTSLNMLPLMMVLELQDITFFIKSLASKTDSFNVLKFVSFIASSTRSTRFTKLSHTISKTKLVNHFYFRRLPRLWNALPPIDLDLPVHVISTQLKKFFWMHFLSHFDPNDPCTCHFICPCFKCSNAPTPSNFSTCLSTFS